MYYVLTLMYISFSLIYQHYYNTLSPAESAHFVIRVQFCNVKGKIMSCRFSQFRLGRIPVSVLFLVQHLAMGSYQCWLSKIAVSWSGERDWRLWNHLWSTYAYLSVYRWAFITQRDWGGYLKHRRVILRWIWARNSKHSDTGLLFKALSPNFFKVKDLVTM